jgi:hypothetical protein
MFLLTLGRPSKLLFSLSTHWKIVALFQLVLLKKIERRKKRAILYHFAQILKRRKICLN